MYPVGATFESVFGERMRALARLGVAWEEGGRLQLAPGREDRETLDVLAELTAPYLESYRLAVETARSAGIAGGALDRKALVKAGLERGRAQFLAGRVLLRESLSRASIENAMEWLSGQGAFTADPSGKRVVAEEWRDGRLTQLVDELDQFLGR
jgi:glycerol-3-phosphate O-acyltransferase